MKFGPVEIRLARSGGPPGAVDLAEDDPSGSKPRSPLRRGEIGATGTEVFAGMLTQQDYNPDIGDTNRYTIYDKMRKSDGQVRAGLMAIKLPLLRAEWPVEP